MRSGRRSAGFASQNGNTDPGDGVRFHVRGFKNRGVDDVLFAVVDGLKGFPHAITAVFPRAIVQTCIVHLIRNSLAFVSWQDRKRLMPSLRAIYRAETAEAAELRLGDFEAEWGKKYPAIGPSWRRAWNEVVPFFAYLKRARSAVATGEPTFKPKCVGMALRSSAIPLRMAMYATFPVRIIHNQGSQGTLPTMLSVPTVGVVIANHNNSKFVARAIDSVARQTIRNVSVIIVDDASTDESDLVIREHLTELADVRFQYLKLQYNVGQAGTLRRGLSRLDTPFVSFLDSDDLWYNNFVERHLEAHLNADFPVALTYCDSRIIDFDDRLLAGTAWWFDSDPSLPARRTIDASQIPKIEPTTGLVTYSPRRVITLYSQWSPDGATNTTASMMFRRSFIDLVFLPPDEELLLYVDFYLATFACLLTGAIAIQDALYAYRMHGLNKHSNASVLGGAYNSSKQPWRPIRTRVLQLIQSVLLTEGECIRSAFGDQRYAEAEALLANELAKLQGENGRRSLSAKWLSGATELVSGYLRRGKGLQP